MTDDAAEKNPLGYSFFVFSVLMEDWFRCEPDHVRFVSYLSTEYGEDKPIPDEVRDKWHGEVEGRKHLRRRIQEHSNAIMFFGDQQGIDMTALIRFMRAVEDRCEFSEVNEQEVHDCFEKAHLRHLAVRQQRNQEDKAKEITQKQPDNPDVRDLCHLLDKNSKKLKSKEKTEIGVAREFIRNDEKKSQSLLRQARRYPHLWKRADK